MERININTEKTISNGKIPAIISHFWIIGIIIAFALNLNEKNTFTSFYIRQMIGLNLVQLLNGVLIYKSLGATASWIVGVFLFIGWIISLFGSFKGEEKLIPYIGEYFQKWFIGF